MIDEPCVQDAIHWWGTCDDLRLDFRLWGDGDVTAFIEMADDAIIVDTHMLLYEEWTRERDD